MFRATLAFAGSLALLMTLGGVARADIGPGPDDPPACTEAGSEQPGVDCEECETSQCESELEGTEYEYVCSRDEGDAVVEVWCDGD